jgi:hypothetical protein
MPLQEKSVAKTLHFYETTLFCGKKCPKIGHFQAKKHDLAFFSWMMPCRTNTFGQF